MRDVKRYVDDFCVVLRVGKNRCGWRLKRLTRNVWLMFQNWESGPRWMKGRMSDVMRWRISREFLHFHEGLSMSAMNELWDLFLSWADKNSYITVSCFVFNRVDLVMDVRALMARWMFCYLHSTWFCLQVPEERGISNSPVLIITTAVRWLRGRERVKYQLLASRRETIWTYEFVPPGWGSKLVGGRNICCDKYWVKVIIARGRLALQSSVVANPSIVTLCYHVAIMGSRLDVFLNASFYLVIPSLFCESMFRIFKF